MEGVVLLIFLLVQFVISTRPIALLILGLGGAIISMVFAFLFALRDRAKLEDLNIQELNFMFNLKINLSKDKSQVLTILENLGYIAHEDESSSSNTLLLKQCVGCFEFEKLFRF
jgi:hypothetical protein